MECIIILIILVSVMMFLSSSATNLTVGGSNGWSLSSNIAQWSASTSFFVNDSLVFIYTPDHDVIEVNKADFPSCGLSNPIATYNDGETVILLNETGTRYFVCGRSHHCAQGLKLRVPVLDQHSPTGQSPQPNTTNTTSPAQPQQGPSTNGTLTDHGHGSPPSSNGCTSVGFLTFTSFLLNLGISFVVFGNHVRLC